MTPEVTTLPNGDRILYRPVVPEDKELIARGFETLSRETRYLRFSMPKTELTEAELAFYTEMDGKKHFAVAAGLIDENDEPIEGIGIARYVGLPDADGVAELAIVVADRYQNQGVGTRLMELLLHEGKANGLRGMTAHVQRTNRTAMLLVEKCVERFDVHLEGSYRVFTWDL
ncbi:MAG: GNAT family N-acetyltransferase [Planctomycetota bacterium]|jgi:acetyltransferase